MKIHCIIPSSPWLADSKTNIPLGVLYIAAVLREAGHDVVVTSRLGKKAGDKLEWSSEALECPIHLIGFCTPQFNESLDIAADLKARDRRYCVVAGGPHPSYEPREVKQANCHQEHPTGPLARRRDYTCGDGPPLFDAVVVMEGEAVIGQLLSDYATGNLQPYYHGDKTQIPNLDVIPFPAWDLLPLDHIYNNGGSVMKNGKNEPCLSVIGTRGCPYKCIYCSTPWIGQKPRYRSSGNIIGEMERAMGLGIRQFKFQDDTYTLHRSKLRELASDVRSAFRGESFACRIHTRVNTLDDYNCESLHMMNCTVTCFGIETGSQKVLDRNLKGTTVKQNTEALKIAKKHGFHTIGFLIAGLAGETPDTARETMDWLDRVHGDLDTCNLAVAIPYPGCPYWENPEKSGIEILDYNYDNQWLIGFSARNEILVRPHGTSYDEMMTIKSDMFEFLVDRGWAKGEWQDDARIKQEQEVVHVG